MVGTLYDHVVAVILVGTLFVVAVIAVPNIGYVGMFHVDEQQLRNIAAGALKTMLLDPGYPDEWGSGEHFNSTALKRFGLALSNGSFFYELDSDKVQRLVTGDPLGYLEYSKVRELLGLQGYGFGMAISAPFNVTVTPKGDVNQTSWEKSPKFAVTVTYSDKKPVPNARVDAMILYSYLEKKDPQNDIDNKYGIRFVRAVNVTNELGKSGIEGSISDPTGKVEDNIVTVFRVTVANVATLTTVYRMGAPVQGIADINMVGDDLVLTRATECDPNSNNWLASAAIITDEGLMSLYNGTKQGDMLNYGSKDVWEKTFNELKGTNPGILVFNFNAVVKYGGRGGVLMVGPTPAYLGQRVRWFGGTPKGTTVSLHRTVQVCGMTYILEFVLWKEFQP